MIHLEQKYITIKINTIVQFRDGSWALIEVKLGDREDIESAAKKLKEIRDDIDESTGKLAFLMIITKDLIATRREDGIYEVPLACLKP